MQSDYALLRTGLAAFLASATQRILSELPPDMSGSLRAQHLGIFLAVVSLTELDEVATAATISSFVKLAKTHVGTALKVLVEIGVLDRKKVPPMQGRGFMYVYTPSADLSKLREIRERDIAG